MAWRRRSLGSVAVLLLAALSVGADDAVRLTDDGRLKFTPTFIDEESLAYVDFVKPELTQIQKLRLSDRLVEPLHRAKAQEFEPAFSPDGRYCAFVQTIGGLSLALVIRDQQTKQDSVLPPGGGFCGYKTPAISPDSKRVVYSFADNGKQDLYSVDLQAKDRRKLTKNQGMNYWPSYSPDGRQILFGSTRDGNYDLYVMSADGEKVQRLTDNPFQDLRPRFSPDGKQIVFTSTREGGNYDVYLMQADGSNVQRLTTNPERDDYPAWHPDGRRIVLVSERKGRHDLYLMDLP